eukprot:534894-Hanusia_phi.AAC.1
MFRARRYTAAVRLGLRRASMIGFRVPPARLTGAGPRGGLSGQPGLLKFALAICFLFCVLLLFG